MATRPFRFAVQKRGFDDPDEIAGFARHVESLGYDELYSYDHVGAVDPFVPLIPAASATDRLRVGPLVLNNEFHHNTVYGFDPHDFSQGFEVAYNKVHDNGKHGIIFSRGCTLNNIHHNEVYANGEHGIMLDRGSNVNQIE